MTETLGLLVSLISLVAVVVLGMQQLRLQRRQDNLVAAQQAIVKSSANLRVSFADQQKEGDRAPVLMKEGRARIPLIIRNDGNQTATDVAIELRLDPAIFVKLSVSARALEFEAPEYRAYQLFLDHPIYPDQEVWYALDIVLNSTDVDSSGIVTIYWTDSIPNVKPFSQTFVIRNEA